MAIRKILTIPDPILYKVSEEVTKFDKNTRDLVFDMFETMYDQDGVGLAAVQIGVLKRIIVIDLEFMNFVKGVFINPKVTYQSTETQYGEEGCLSVPGLSAPLVRPKHVEILYYDISGNKNTIQAKDIMARAFLHEIDHLDGKIYVDQLEKEIKRDIQEDLDRVQVGKPPLKERIPEYRKKRRAKKNSQ